MILQNTLQPQLFARGKKYTSVFEALSALYEQFLGQYCDEGTYICAITRWLRCLDTDSFAGLASARWVFEYLAMLRKQGPQEWVYQELADIGNMRARFKEETDAVDYVGDIVGTMLYVKPEHTLVADDVFRDWDPQLVSQHISHSRCPWAHCLFPPELYDKMYNHSCNTSWYTYQIFSLSTVIMKNLDCLRELQLVSRYICDKSANTVSLK